MFEPVCFGVRRETATRDLHRAAALRSDPQIAIVIFGDGSQTRDFTYVSDTARGILLAASSNKAVGETINLGSGRALTINDLAADVAPTAEQPNLDIVYEQSRPGDVLRLYADTTKARELLGFEPQISLREGLTKQFSNTTGRSS